MYYEGQTVCFGKIKKSQGALNHSNENWIRVKKIGGMKMAMFYGKSFYKWIVLVVCILIYSSGNLVRLNYTGIASYIMGEWNIGKPELGILGSAFFYAYALGQSTWGTLTDLIGGRRVIPIGIGITVVLMGAFSFADSFNQAIIIRALLGFVGAATFVPCLVVIGRWFGKKERGMAMNLFSGPGGGFGECWSFLMMPVMALFMTKGLTIFGLSTWRAATLITAGFILMIAIMAYVFLRSDPSEMGLESVYIQEDKKTEQNINYKEIVFTALRDPVFWVFAFVWQGFTVCLRLIPGWLPLYATAFYAQTAGLGKAEAMVAGGAMATTYVIGRIVGPPVMGKFSDYLLVKHGVPRVVMLVSSFTITLICVYLFTTAISSPILLGILSFVLGVSINLLSILNTIIVETWSIKTTGALNGVINTFCQFIGATALTFSGYMAVRFSVKGGGFNAEYQGIWFLVMISVGLSILASLYAVYSAKKSSAPK